MASAGTAGFMYWVAFYPTDVVKSAMMTDSLDPVRRHAVLRPPFSAILSKDPTGRATFDSTEPQPQPLSLSHETDCAAVRSDTRDPVARSSTLMM